MAINFLDNIQLNQNQLLGARIENVTSDPTSANGGDIIYNSTQNVLKYYDGTTPFSANGWISLPDGTGIGGNGTVGTIPVFNGVTEITDSRLQTTGSGTSQTFTFNTNGTTSFKGEIQSTANLFLDGANGKGGLKDKDGDLGTAGQLLSSTGTATNWINAPVSYTKWIAEGALSSLQDVNDGDTYKLDESTTNPGIRVPPNSKSGTTITQPLSLFTKNMTTAAPSAFSTDVLLWGTSTSATGHKVQKTHIDDIPVSAWGEAQDIVNMDGHNIIKVLDPVNAQDAATKNYVDNAIVGGFNVKGGFNANTGVTAVAGTNLYTNTAVAVGDYYVVTVAGNFFGNAATPLTPGDSVLAQRAAASGSAIESDFAVIQSDTDIATLSQIGIGNVNADTTPNSRGIEVGYTNGTAEVGLEIKGATLLPQAVGGQDKILIWDGTSGNQGNYGVEVDELSKGVSKINNFAANNASSGTSHTFTHNLGTSDVTVQLYDTSTKETVYATVDRTGVNTVVVATASSISSGAIRALISKVG